MTNEQYLIVSYFVVAAVSLLIGLGVYLRLRDSLKETAAALPWKAARELVTRLFPAGILLPALLGFVSVSYKGCGHEEYEKVVADRSYLITRNEAQIGATLTHLMWAIFAWCALIALLLILKRRRERLNSTENF